MQPDIRCSECFAEPVCADYEFPLGVSCEEMRQIIRVVRNHFVDANKMVPTWVRIDDRPPKFHVNDDGCICTNGLLFATEHKTVHLGYCIKTFHNIETIEGFERIDVDRWYDQNGNQIEDVDRWLQIPVTKKEVGSDAD